ncbi:MAG: hypothetical protein J1E60_07390, partial [Christensenellaceae bacterium]|nr:hypothetical protein [Christensenellaceae bacterium]
PSFRFMFNDPVRQGLFIYPFIARAFIRHFYVLLLVCVSFPKGSFGVPSQMSFINIAFGRFGAANKL